MNSYDRGTSTVFELLILGAIIAVFALAIGYGIAWDIRRNMTSFPPRAGYIEWSRK